MAPLEDYERITHLPGVRWYGLAAAKHAGQIQPRDASSAASGAASSRHLYAGVGVGGLLLVASIVVVFMIVKKRREHKRAVEVLEVEEAVQLANAQRQEIGEVPRPVASLRSSALAPLNARAGWGALSSDEQIHDPQSTAQRTKRERASIGLPKKFKHRGIPLKRLKRLTAILESPRSRITASPALPCHDCASTKAIAGNHSTPKASNKAYTLRRVNDDDVFVCPDSPKANVLPSFAIRSPGRYGAGIAFDPTLKAPRSRSVSAMGDLPGNAILRHTSRLSKGPMHARSISLGAPPSRPPTGPVPPLPVIEPHEKELTDHVGEAFDVSRTSSPCQESPGSSVLITSPVLKLHERDKPTQSPSVEQMVAPEENASLKNVAQRQWQKPLVRPARSVSTGSDKENREGANSHSPIRSNIARYSAESQASNRVSPISKESQDSAHNILSIPRIGTADQISISRVSSTDSLNSYTSIRKVHTPRKISRSSVSASGSPAERKKTGVLRDISGNTNTPPRKGSNATQNSSRSSNGNPFQWDQPLPKPSALKGSPNARKGHRRQNCVRISTLTPQVLGPPPSRPTSPSIMHGIAEESGESDDAATQPGVRFVSNHRLSRPMSASYSVPNLRPSNLRASLTPSSPTLSAWTAFQEHGLPSEHSDSQLSVSVGSRSLSRTSNRSSNFSLPRFPSPGKATLAEVQLSKPVPEFCLSRPSTDVAEHDSSSPFGLQLSAVEMPSSPPLPTSKKDEYDPAHPAWPIVTIPIRRADEYDPASPAWEETEPERSSAFFPFAKSAMEARDDDEVSSRSRPVSYGGDMPDTPPVSPKTMPEGFQAFFDSSSKPPRAAEKLTSANASSMMARTPSKVDFPGAPILPPPDEDECYSQFTPGSTKAKQPSSWTHPMRFQPLRRAPPPPMSAADDIVPSPLHIANKTSPQGPRKQPANSLLKNAMALRRMNSEVNTIADRESRRYVRLGREASPLLPWIGSQEPSESCANMVDLFDFDFAADAGPGAEEHSSALDEIDMTEVERKLDGAIAGFDAATSPGLVREERSSSVWEDGEKYWQQHDAAAAFARSGLPYGTPTKAQPELEAYLLATPRSIQHTPKSLYDSDGFLQT